MVPSTPLIDPLREFVCDHRTPVDRRAPDMEEGQIQPEDLLPVPLEHHPPVQVHVLDVGRLIPLVEGVLLVSLLRQQEAREGRSFQPGKREVRAGPPDVRVLRRLPEQLVLAFHACDEIGMGCGLHVQEDLVGLPVETDIIIDEQGLGPAALPDELERPVPGRGEGEEGWGVEPGQDAAPTLAYQILDV